MEFNSEDDNFFLGIDKNKLIIDIKSNLFKIEKFYIRIIFNKLESSI